MPRVLFRDTIPYSVVTSLQDLQGPISGQVVLPHHIYWGPGQVFELPLQVVSVYNAVLENGSVADMCKLLNAWLLQKHWASINPPLRVKSLWESRFPWLQNV